MANALQIFHTPCQPIATVACSPQLWRFSVENRPNFFLLEDEELVAGTEKKGVVGLWGLVLILHRPEDDDVLGRYL